VLELLKMAVVYAGPSALLCGLIYWLTRPPTPATGDGEPEVSGAPGAQTPSIGVVGDHVGGYYLADADGTARHQVSQAAHAGDLDPRDRALTEMLKGAQFGDGVSITLPSGTVVDGSQMRQLQHQRICEEAMDRRELREQMRLEHKVWNDAFNRKIQALIKSGASGADIAEFSQTEMAKRKQYERERRNGE